MALTAAQVRRWTARFGLLLMVVSFLWLGLLPRGYRSLVRNPPRPENDAVARVVIDAGHGGKDSGAIHNGVLEKDLTLDVARRVERVLQNGGLTTIMTRAGDDWISLGGRVAAANRERNCVFVSVHFDEGARAAATGVQTFYAARQAQNSLVPAWLPFLQPAASETPSLKSQSLAGFVQESLVSKTQAFNRGTRAEQFYVVANVRHPAVLVEGGFLSNPADLARLTTESYREQLAGAIADGIMRYREAVQKPATVAVSETAAE